MNKVVISTLLVATLVLSGCGLFGKKNSSAAGQGSTSGAGNNTSGVGTSGYPPAVQIGGNPDGSLSGSGGASAGSIVYFEFDSIALTAEGEQVVARFGKNLSENPASRLRLEGHADERGTREYNIGLAERRANAVQQALLANGASAAQMSIVSYGEERPVNSQHSEEAWAANRRVELVKL